MIRVGGLFAAFEVRRSKGVVRDAGLERLQHVNLVLVIDIIHISGRIRIDIDIIDRIDRLRVSAVSGQPAVHTGTGGVSAGAEIVTPPVQTKWSYVALVVMGRLSVRLVLMFGATCIPKAVSPLKVCVPSSFLSSASRFQSPAIMTGH